MWWTIFKYLGIPVLLTVLGLGAKVGWDHYQQAQFEAIERDKSFERRDAQAEIIHEEAAREREALEEGEERRTRAVEEAGKVKDLDSPGDPALTRYLNLLLP